MSEHHARQVSKDSYRLARFADHWAGGLLLFLLGLFFRRRRSPPQAQDIRTAVIIKFDGIGDAVLVTGVARDLRAAAPGVKIVLVCGPFNRPIVSLLSAFDEIVCLSLSRPWRSAREIRRKRADVCIDLGEWSRVEALLAFFSGARWTAGFRTPGQHRHYAYDQSLPLRFDRHELDNYRSLFALIGVKTGLRPLIELKVASRPLPAEFAAAKPFAILHLWSGSATWARLKEWPFDRWRELARWLNGRGMAVFLTGGTGDRRRTDEFIASCRWPGCRVGNVTGIDFEGLIALVRECAVVVSIDTSITHIAAALDARVLSLHGPSSSKRWGPVGPRAEAIDSPLSGCGYMNWGADSNRRKARLQCMESVPLGDVIKRVEKMLALNPT